MAVESKHVMTITKQKREVEKRETQYARNKVCINHARAIRRTGIYSISESFELLATQLEIWVPFFISKKWNPNYDPQWPPMAN
jgi:hypothetical protein